MSEHTPVPWKFQCEIEVSPGIAAGSSQIRKYPIYTASGKFGHPAMAKSEADAKFIVQACNSHEAMKEALRTAVETIRALHGMQMSRLEEPRMWSLYQASPEMKQIHAALALAEAKP